MEEQQQEVEQTRNIGACPYYVCAAPLPDFQSDAALPRSHDGDSGLFRPADFMFHRVPQRPRAVVFVKHLPNLLLHAKTDTLKHLITTDSEETPV